MNNSVAILYSPTVILSKIDNTSYIFDGFINIILRFVLLSVSNLLSYTISKKGCNIIIIMRGDLNTIVD